MENIAGLVEVPYERVKLLAALERCAAVCLDIGILLGTLDTSIAMKCTVLKLDSV